MIAIRKRDVPKYLHSSTHFINAFEGTDDGDEVTIEIPADCLKPNPDIEGEEDLRALLLTVRYWLIPECAETDAVFSFALKDKLCYCRTVSEFELDFPVLAKLCTALQSSQDYTLIGYGSQFGLLSFVKYLRGTGVSWETSATKKQMKSFPALAALHGHLECLEYAVQNCCPLSYDVCGAAVHGGHDDCLRYAHQHCVFISIHDAAEAVLRGHLACVKYIIESKAVCSRRDLVNLVDNAAESGQLDVLAYLLSVCDATVSTANAAAAYDTLGCLKLLHEKGCPVTSETVDIAVHCGSMRCLEYLCSIGCGWAAAPIGNLPFGRNEAGTNCAHHDNLVTTFMYAVEHGCAISQNSMTTAAKLGSVAFLKHLHERGLSLDTTAFHVAIATGNAACMQYFLDHGYVARTEDHARAVNNDRAVSVRCLHEHGVAWDTSLNAKVILCDCARIFEYLLTIGCAVATNELMFDVVTKKNPRCMKVIHEHGVALTEAMFTLALTIGAGECVAYALSQGCPRRADAAVLAASLGDWQSLRCLHKHGAEMTPAVFDAAMQRGSYNCMIFVVHHGCLALGPVVCASAAKLKSWRRLKHLHEESVPWDSSTCLTAVRSHAFETLKYAVKKGCPVGDCVLPAEAALLGRRDMLKWLHKKGVFWDARTTEAAVQCDSVDCLKYCIEQQCPYEVHEKELEKAPRCHSYMVKRGHKLVQRTLTRKLAAVEEKRKAAEPVEHDADIKVPYV